MNDLSARVARLKLIGELLSQKKLLSETPADARIERLKRVRRMLEIRKIIGESAPPAVTVQDEPSAATDDGPEDATYEEVGEARNPAARFYDFNPNRKPAQRRRENAAAIALLRQIRAGEVDGDNLSDDQRATLARYSGTGGALEGEDGKRGSAYEYYTPKPIAQGAWELLREMGFAGGKVLDPCGGTGIFGGTAPADAAVDAVELNQTSGEVNALVNKGPGYTCTVSPFERVAASTPDEIYDAVITNVPFGDKVARGGNELADTRYRGEPLEGYFILRSLEKLKPGGLALFITPHRTVSGKGGTEVSIRRRASLMAEFMGAYRLPSSLFLSAGAETITDIVVFRKHGAEASEKIAELEEQAPSKLVEARVCWTEFIEGGYFAGEGRKFVLGEFKAADPEKRRGKFGDIDRVLSDKTPVEVAKLLRRFGGSRIDWDVLKATETMPIVYADGDTITQAGQTLQLRDGAWAVVKAVDDEGGAMAALGAKLADPLAAFTARVSWQDARAYVAFMRRMSRHGDIPQWLASAAAGLQRLAGEGARAQGWHAGITALSVQQVFEYHQADGGTDYASQYPDLTTEMQRCASDMAALPAAAGDMIRGACALVRTLYTRKRGLSGVWTGQRAAEAADTRTDAQRFDAAKYGAGDVWVDLAKAREVFGEDFDPVADDAWCLSPDGQRVARADDVFIGNLGDALRRLEADAKAATDERVRGKILAQIAEAQRRVQRVDVSQMGFNLFSPFVTLEERCEFMRKFVDPGFGIVWDEDSGERNIEFTVNDSKLDTVARAEDKKLFRRMAIYLRNSTVTLGTAEFGDRERAMSRLRELTQSSNEQFSAWCRSNPEIIGRLSERANDPDRLYFAHADDQSPIPLPGMRIGTPPDGITPHGYQFAFVRKSGREFGGINGFSVGLGKAQPISAKVLTPHGWKRMGDIVQGDVVIAGDGTPTRVTGVFPQGEKEIFEVAFNDGAKARCCDDHLWFTSTEADRKRMRRAGIPVQSCAMGEVRSLREIRASLRSNNGRLKNHSIPMVGVVQGDEAVLPVHPYLLGVLIGDGSLTTKSVYYSKPDDQIRDRVAHLLKHDFGDEIRLRDTTPGDSNKTYRMTRTSAASPNPLKQELLKFGLMGKGSHERFIPDAYLSASAGQRLELLRGLMDTDGYASRDGCAIQYTSTSHLLATQVMALAQSFGANAWITSKVPTFTHKGVKKQGRVAYTVGMRMPAGINPFLLERKAARFRPNTKYLPTRLIDTVTSVGIEPAQCISVDHPSRLYVTDDYVVTHNTLTALACVQHAHNIGSKKRTMFVVPNSVLSNWRKEASGAYQSLDDCLFVGLSFDKQGKPRVRAQDYDADLMRIFEGRHSKIFLTFEAFERLRLKDETMAGFEAYMREVDTSFAESMDKKDDERAAGKVKRLAAILAEGKKASTPFLEDLGVDSLVVDEAHAFKASATASSFEAAKYLALSDTSARGIDMQAKAWFIRGLSAKGDGVMPLTATPITNSPLEIYAMMSLGVGHRRVNDMALGCKGADDFLSMVCRVESEMDETMDGIVRETRVFTGLDNVHVLRGMIGACATVETAETVGMAVKVPGMVEQETPVAMPEPPTINMLKDYKAAYRYAADKLSGRGENRGDPDAFERIQAKFGEPLELIAHPFNLIRKMELLIMDPELDQRATFFTTLPDAAAKVADIVAKFNALRIIEERPRPGPRTAEDAIVGEKTKKVGDEKVVVLRIHARAIIDGNRVVLDTIDPETIARFEELADAAGADLDVTVPPKLAALVANVRAEEMNPRGVDDDGNPTPKVKQIIFCDILPLHRKIRRLLSRRAGVPAGQIAIITGKTNNKPEQIQAVQDGFNAHGEDNVYRYVIANEKAEVGINLQRGTQATHHLTIGWTPDSLTQRNGRGARQGNKTETVTVYYYDADGTFDAHKRTLVARKASWIDEVMDPGGGTSVDIESGMSREQLEALIDTVGDQDAMTRFTESLAQKEKAAREEGNRGKQATNLRTVLSQQAFLKANPTVQDWCASKLRRLVELTKQADKMQARIDDTKASASALLRNQQTMAAMQAEMRGLGAEIDATLTLYQAGKYGGFNRYEPITASDLARKLIHDAGKKAVSMEAISVHCRSGSALKAGGPLEVEWRSEVDMAKAMLEQSARRAAELSAGENAIPAAVVESFVQGKGAFVDGKAVVDGAIIETKDGMHLVTDSGTTILGWASRPDRLPIGSTSGATTVHLPGSASFEEAARRAAAFEDEKVRAAKTISVIQMADTFAANSAEIAKYRVERTRIPVTTQETVLPAPYFPVPIHPSRVKPEMIALARIVAHQAEIVSWDGTLGSIAADAGASRYQPKPGSYSPGRPFLPDLAAYAAAHSLKVSVGEAQAVGLGHQSGWSLAEAFRVKPEAPFDAASHTTVEELDKAIEAHLIAHHPHLQLDKDMTIVTLESMSTHGYAVSRRRRELVAAAQRDAAAPPAPAPAAATPPPPPPPPVPVAAASVTAKNPVAPETIPDDQVVGIRGDTKPVKDDIKKACYDVGSKPQWNGDAVMWGVPFKAWKLLLERFPDIGKRLSICEFQAKTGAKAYSSAPRSPYASTYRRR